VQEVSSNDSAKVPQIDQAKLRQYRLRRVRDQLVAMDYAGALLFDPINIRYATGTSNMQVWTLHNAARYAFVPGQGPVVLFETHGCHHLAANIETVNEVRSAIPWYFFGAGPRSAKNAKQWANEVADLVALHGGGNKRLAVDRCNPFGAAELLQAGITLHDAQEVLEIARAIKSPEEIAAIELSLKVCESGMRRMQEAMVPGITENGLWSLLHQENIAHGGEWIETRLLTSGIRTNPWMQESSNRKIEAGDLLCFDTDLIGPNGYLADISRSWLVGGGRATDEQRRLYATAHEQIEFNTALLRPGLGFRELMEKAWKITDIYAPNRYALIVHGAGLCDEYPIVPYPQDFEKSGYDGVIEENMVLCVESYIGAAGGSQGVKLEQQVLITPTGCRTLSSYPYEELLL
jgi:Xaa-Pro aminopeptidase